MIRHRFHILKGRLQLRIGQRFLLICIENPIVLEGHRLSENISVFVKGLSELVVYQIVRFRHAAVLKELHSGDLRRFLLAISWVVVQEYPRALDFVFLGWLFGSAKAKIGSS